jgi:predicted small lipoprotein YifL
MKNLKTTLLYICFIFFSLSLTGCGQKGPLIVENAPIVQEDTLDEAEITEESD